MTTPYAWAIGVDTGATTAVALVLGGARAKTGWATSGRWTSAEVVGHVLRLALEQETALGVVCVERVAGAAYGGREDGSRHAMTAHLVGAAERAGYVVGAARQAGLVVTMATALEWRRAVTGHASATSARIAVQLGFHVQLPPRSNEHVRDAIGVGLYGLRGGGAAG